MGILRLESALLISPSLFLPHCFYAIHAPPMNCFFLSLYLFYDDNLEIPCDLNFLSDTVVGDPETVETDGNERDKIEEGRD